jgi:hypothetical protein
VIKKLLPRISALQGFAKRPPLGKRFKDVRTEIMAKPLI